MDSQEPRTSVPGHRSIAMVKPPIPANEAQRLSTLREIGILDTPYEERFDRITRLTRHLLQVPIALVSLVDETRQWFKSHPGLSARQTPRDVSFCAHAICEPGSFVVPNALNDERFAANPLVVGPPAIRFYAAHTLEARNGSQLGTLCIIDSKPRTLGETEKELLRELAGLVEDELNMVHISRMQEQLVKLKAAEQALIEQAAQLREQADLLNLAHDSIIVRRLDGRIDFWSRGAEVVYGWTAEETRGCISHELLRTRFPQSRAAIETELLQNGRWEGELVHQRRDGQEVVVDSRWTLTCDADQRPRSVLEINSDISDRKRAETAQHESERFARATVDALSAHIAIVDLNGKIIAVNRAWREFAQQNFANPESVLEGANYLTTCDAATASKDAQAVAAAIRSIIAGKRMEFSLEYPCHSSAIQRWFVVRVTRFQGDGPLRVVVAHENITLRKLAERDLRLAKEAAEASNRAKSDFLANMSHELRTPLNSVIGFANILQKNKRKNLSDQDILYLSRIHDSGMHLLSLINHILDLSKVESGRTELDLGPTTLDSLVEETICQMEGLVHGKDIRLLTDVPETVAVVETDAGKLKQVLINLIGNALKFTAQGSVTVRVVTEPSSHVPVCIEVADTGIGIPADRLETVFEAFQQADNSTARKYGGTGLGLTISRAMCHLMGYRLTVQSTVGVGTTFMIDMGATPLNPASPSRPMPLIPLAADDAPPTSTAAAEGPDSLVKPLVLIIDNEVDSRILLAHYIEEAGYRTLTADSGASGLRLARQYTPDIITLDLEMPEMNGWDVLKEFKGDPKLKNIPTIVISISARENRSKLPGAAALLDKPVPREELLRILATQLRQPSKKAKVTHE